MTMKFIFAALTVFICFSASSQAACPRTNSYARRFCEDACVPSKGCRSSNKICLCDGDCGYSCIPKGLSCGNPPRFRRGKAKRVGGSSFNATITYKCKKYHTLLGSAKRTCRGIGKWDGKRARCKIICKRLQTPSNAIIKNAEGRRVKHRVRYECWPGYKMVGSATVTCQPNGKWNNNPPRCEVIKCKLPPRNKYPPNARLMSRVQNPYVIYNQRLLYACVAGYNLIRSPWIRCTTDGWSEPQFRCIPKSCGRPGIPKNGGHQRKFIFTFKEKVVYYCNYGYNLRGSIIRQCQANEQWSGKVPTCTPKDCGPLSVPRNGRKLSEDKTTFGGTIKFQCDEQLGYELKGSKQRTCQGDGTWSGVQTTCQLLSCGDPGAIPNGRRFATNRNFYLSSVRFECNRGYTLQGRRSIICQKDKTWSDAAPKCYKSCPRPPNANGRRFQGNDFSHGKYITFICSSGFTMDGTKNLRCSDGQWSQNFPVCRASCRNPGSPSKGAISRRAYSYRHGEKATFYCYSGYKLVGIKEINCFDGNWGRFQMPSCIAECKDPGSLTNGQRAGDNFLDGNVVRYRCNWNYDLFGSSTIFCNKGKWNATRPSCHRRCTNPGGIPNGNKKGTNYKHGDSVVYSCSRDYVLVGRGTLRCSYGRWNYQVPRCQAPCRPPPTPRNGGIRLRKSSYLHGQKVSLYCNSGYSLVGSSSRWCNNGRWSSRTPSCKASCKNPGLLKNGRIWQRQPGQYTHGTILIFFCNAKHRRFGSRSITCNDGAWNGNLPKCIAVCTDPGYITNGRRTRGRSFNEGEKVTYKCIHQSYVLVGTSVLQCKNGDWTAKKPACKAPCPKPDKITDGNFTGNDFRHSKQIRYSCNSPYVIHGNPFRSCIDGRWNSTLPKCVAPKCKPITKVLANGTVDQKGSHVSFSCDPGFTLEGPKTLSCINGRWNATKPPVCIEIYRHAGCFQVGANSVLSHILGLTTKVQECYKLAVSSGYKVFGFKLGQVCVSGKGVTIATFARQKKSNQCRNGLGHLRAVDVYEIKEKVKCTKPKPPHNGKINGSNIGFQNRIQFECNNGYDLFGRSSANCLSNGNWSSATPICEAQCKILPTRLLNGLVKGHGNRSRQNVTFQCKAGFKLQGSSRLTCRDGNWSHDFPSCKQECVGVGADVLGFWIRSPRNAKLYFEANITRLDSFSTELKMKKPHPQFRLKKTFNNRNRNRLSIIMDRIPDADDLTKNTRVVALFTTDNLRFFSGKIFSYWKARNKYLIRYDDGDWAHIKREGIRLAVPPLLPFCS